MLPIDITPEHVGRNLKRIREGRGLSRDDLAKVSGYSLALIERLENGRCYPSVASLLDLCAALGVTPNDVLIGGRRSIWKIANG